MIETAHPSQEWIVVVLGLLCLAAALLFRAVMKQNETLLLVAVALYAGVVVFIVKTAPELLVPAIVVALALAALGLVRFLAAKARLNLRPQLMQAFFKSF